MEVTSKKTYEEPSDSRKAIMDYSRARVKPGMCRDYPRAVLVQIAPTPSCPKIRVYADSCG